jgi:drug/metabolite transporter (DMT)-like permease
MAVCLIWGTTYLGIRISLETMPPMIMAGLRWTFAGGLLAAYMATRGERLPRPRGWGNALVLGFLMLVMGNGGVVWAEQSVPSGLAAVVVASSPFWMAGVEAFRKDGERMTWRTAAGFVLGFLGILLLVWPELWRGGTGGHRFVAGVIALQIACLGWSIGSS